MRTFIRIAVAILLEVADHYIGQVKHTHTDGPGSGDREKRLREKIREQWRKRHA